MLQTACASITAQYATIFSARCVPLTLGGDHLITYPILRAAAATHGPLAVRGVHSILTSIIELQKKVCEDFIILKLGCPLNCHIA